MSGRHIASFAELAATKRKLIALPEVSSKIATLAAERLSALAKEAFGAGKTVYGDTRPEGSRGTSLDLKESGALGEKATQYIAEGRRIRASMGGLGYSKYYVRYGVLPFAGKLPPVWDAEISALAERELNKAVTA